MYLKKFKEQSRSRNTNFTRDRKINFIKILIIIMSMFKRTSQVEIDDIIKRLNFRNKIDMTYTKQAFSEARQKLLPYAFIFDNFIKEFYSDGEFKKYKRFVICGIDGCVHEIPNNSET